MRKKMILPLLLIVSIAFASCRSNNPSNVLLTEFKRFCIPDADSQVINKFVNTHKTELNNFLTSIDYPIDSIQKGLQIEWNNFKGNGKYKNVTEYLTHIDKAYLSNFRP